MEDRYKSFSATQLAAEDSFIGWILRGENDQEWLQWQKDFPDQTSKLDMARYIVQTMSGRTIPSLQDHAKSDLWNLIQSETTGRNNKTGTQKQIRFLRWSLVAAAAIALLIWAGTAQSVDNVIVKSGEKEEISLPENSVVTVNAGSKVSYNKRRFRDEREIKLDGEAFFKVSPGSKFTVVTSQGNVTVLGTSFNVISRPGRFEVSCFTGRVKVEQGGNDKVEITPGEKCYADKVQTKLTLNSFDASTLSPDWIQGKFTFDKQPLSVVVAELERQYGVTVKLSPGLEDIRYSGLFELGDLEKADSLITWPLHLQAKISGKTITISR